ncbi:MAG: hypothetical protein CVU18_19000 [Betaproteobacteria bacterium HGW-Betaproteobacteria-12]|nr:MAG: hypothetical protein CVU18_19000 [Betaproteobacteria bacterium HGW-Betaproteobacteria-12]
MKPTPEQPISHSPPAPRSWRGRLLAALLPLLLATPAAIGSDATGAPVLEVQQLDGSRLTLADTRGAITVVVFWSAESLASRKSLGELQRFAALPEQREIRIIAVSTLNDAGQLRHFASERQLDLPLAILGLTNLGPFPEPSLPHIHVFDRSGRLHASHRGLFRLQTLDAMVAPLRRP